MRDEACGSSSPRLDDCFHDLIFLLWWMRVSRDFCLLWRLDERYLKAFAALSFVRRIHLILAFEDRAARIPFILFITTEIDGRIDSSNLKHAICKSPCQNAMMEMTSTKSMTTILPP